MTCYREETNLLFFFFIFLYLFWPNTVSLETVCIVGASVSGQKIINWTSPDEHEHRACRYARVKFNLRMHVNATQMTWQRKVNAALLNAMDALLVSARRTQICSINYFSPCKWNILINPKHTTCIELYYFSERDFRSWNYELACSSLPLPRACWNWYITLHEGWDKEMLG